MKNADSFEVVSTDSLFPYISNSRTHSDDQVTQIAASIREFGFLNPILIDSSNSIIAGHGRLLAAKKLGLSEVPILRIEHLTEAQRKAYVIADNKLALNAGWDDEVLKAEIEHLKELEFDIGLLGFTDKEFDALFFEKQEGETDPYKEWEGMPEYEAVDPCYKKVVVNFDTQEDVDEFFSLISQEYTDKTKSIWFPEKQRRNLEASRWEDE